MKDYKYIQDRRTGTKHRILGVVDDTLTEEGIAADAKVVGDALATKAEVDGYYEELTAGNAEQLISSVYEEDSVPYTFRTSGGSIDIGDREEDKIIGGTVAWNQRLKVLSDESWLKAYMTVTMSNGIASITRTSTEYAGLFNRLSSIPRGHVYLYRATIKSPVSTTKIQVVSNDGSHQEGVKYTTGSNAWEELNILGKYTYDVGIENVYWNIRDDATENWQTFYVKDVGAFDLTQMFGSTIADYIYTLEQSHAGDGVAWFRKLFPKPYYAYNPGELLSVSDLQSHDMVGFNAWDEEWELGAINPTTGQPSASSTSIRCKNFIPVLPNTAYCYHNGSEIDQAPWFYDAEKNFVNRSSSYISTGRVFTIPDNVRYMKFALPATYGTTYKNDICINLHWDGERDGEYEPYKKWSYPLDDSLTLRGIPKLDADNKLYYDGDVYESDGTVTRKYGIVTIDQNTTISQQSIGSTRFYIAKNDMKRSSNYIGIMRCDKLPTRSGYGSEPNTEAFVCGYPDNNTYAGQNWIYISNGVANNAADLKTWLASNPLTVVYELATPTTESADPYQNPQIVDDFGTEEYVTTSIVPVGHETKYQPNLRAKLEMAPNSPDGNGDYIVRHTNGENVYVPLAFPADELPPAPTENGTYRLTVTVNNGTATYAWVSA